MLVEESAESAAEELRFIDLFAGLGGFHLALRQLGHQCVFASELDPVLRSVYEANFGIQPKGDIRDVELEAIPAHDVLCAGFPCQPFSKAGDQLGYFDPKDGRLVDFVVRLLELHAPRYFILENVPNFEKHDRGQTWVRLLNRLGRLGYDIRWQRLSPHQFGIPQIRERMFILGKRGEGSLSGFVWPSPCVWHKGQTLEDVLEDGEGARRISAGVQEVLDAWQQFLDRFPKEGKLPSFPIWSMEFGATYPYEETTPHALGAEGLGEYRGSHGVELRHVPAENVMAHLPSYARVEQQRFPTWKVTFIRQNRELYAEHKAWIDAWMPRILPFPSSHQKFEWNCQNEERTIRKLVVQMRASGVRVKRPDTVPSLVSMSETQVPIIAWQGRYLTPWECARLQSMDGEKGLQALPWRPNRAFEAFGNAVNVDLVRLVASALTGSADGAPAPGAGVQAALPL